MASGRARPRSPVVARAWCPPWRTTSRSARCSSGAVRTPAYGSCRDRRDDHRAVGTYGWDGGYGTSWANDPIEDVVGVLLTNQLWESPQPPPVAVDFWTATYAAMAG